VAGATSPSFAIHTDAATTLYFVAPPTTTTANTIITPGGVTIVLRHEQRLLHQLGVAATAVAGRR